MPNSKEILIQALDALADAINTKANSTGEKSIPGMTSTVKAIATEKPEQVKSVELSMGEGAQVIQPDEGKVLTQVTIEKPQTLVASNIKKDINIGGVIGNFAGGGSAFSITVNMPNGIYSGATSTYPDATGVTVEASIVLTPSEGYELIGITSVTNASYSFNGATRTVTLTNATGDVVVTPDVRAASVGLEFEEVTPTRSTKSGNNTNYVIKGIGTCTDTDIVIPSRTPDSGNVVGIKDIAFQNKNRIKTIAMPYGIMSIGNGAFRYNSNLTSVTIPNSVTLIGATAFSNCSGLTTITIPDSITSIGNEAFSGCTGLTSLIIPSSVTNIGKSAFYNCRNLTSVVISDSITNLGETAFMDCTNLTLVLLGNNITTIDAGAFLNCTSITNVIIPDSVTEIRQNAFNGCSNLTNVTIGNSVTLIGYQAFHKCYELTSVTIPDNVVEVDNFAFPTLNSLVIGKGIRQLSNVSFSLSDSAQVTIMYDGQYEDLLTDSNYLANVITPFAELHKELVVTFIWADDSSSEIMLGDLIGGGSGSGSGSGSGNG